MRLRFFKWRVWLWSALTLAALFIVVLAIAPLVVENRLNELFSTLTCRGKFTVEIKRLDLYGADASIYLAHCDDEAPSVVENLSLRYTPGGLLWHRRIDEVKLRGVTILAQVSDQGVVFPVAKMFPASEKKKSDSAGFDFASLPVKIGKLACDGAIRVEFISSEPGVSPELLYLPIQGEVNCENGNWQDVAYNFNIALPGGDLKLAGNMDKTRLTGKISGVCGGESMPLWVRAKLPTDCLPIVDVDSSFQFGLPGWNLTAGSIDVKLLPRSKLPGNVSIVEAPELLATLLDDKVDFSFSLGAIHRNDATFPLPKLQGNFALSSQLGTGKIGFGKAFKCGELPFAFDLNQKRFELGHPEKTSQDKWRWETLSGEFSGMLPGGSIVIDGATGTVSGSWLLASVKTPLFAVNLPELSVTGKISAPTISCSEAIVKLPAANVILAGINAKVPILSETPGRIEVGKIQILEQDLGKMVVNTRWGDHGIAVRSDSDIAGVQARVVADIDWQKSFYLTGKAEVPRQKFSPTASVLALLPEDYREAQISGEIRAGADLRFADGVFSGSAAVDLLETDVALPAKNWEITGIAASFQLPELPKMSSAARQTLRCGKAKFGMIETGEVQAQLRMDSPTAWDLEKLRVNWCGGVVRSEYFHFDPHSEVFPLTIHCDRLNMAQFLAQIGAGVGNGNGRISGTLPVEYSRKGGIVVEDAFLYTSPGEIGHLELAFSEAVQASQNDNAVFDMAQAALQEFDYSWAKINLETTGDELKLAMQLNGKPVKPLYFTYADGAIVKSEVPHIFQGIMLDVNIALPARDILELVKPF